MEREDKKKDLSCYRMALRRGGIKIILEFEISTGSLSRELASEEAVDLLQDRFGTGTELVCMKYLFLFLVHATVFSIHQSIRHKYSER
jgi:hypothetical protein